jgi:fucose permease
MAGGRLLCSRFNSRFTHIIAIGLGVSLLFLGAMLLFGSPWVLLAGIFMTGFGFGPAWPMLMLLASRRFTGNINAVLGGMMSSSALGGMAVPWLLGAVAGAAGSVSLSFLILPLLVVLLAWMVFRIR